MSAPSSDRRWLVLGICCMSLLIVGLDTTIVNVALPAIHRSLHASLAGLQWIIDAYTLVLGSLLMLGGSTGDRLGRKRIFQIGLITFVFGSALCAVAPSLGVLIAARAFQALGGAMLNPVALSIVRNVFHDPRERAQAVGVWGAMVGFSIGLGPVLGGAFVDTIGWRFVFLVNVPIGLLACLLTAIYVPESRAEHARRVDPVGQVLVILGLATITYAIIEGHADGWTSATILTLFAVSLASFAILVPYELRRFEPLIEVRFFRSVPFSGAAVIAFFAYRVVRGLPVAEHALPPGRPRLFGPAGRAVHVAAGGVHTRAAADLRAHGREPRHARAAAGRRRRHARRAATAHRAQGPHAARVAVRLLCDGRDRARADQPADHQHGDLRHAGGAGGRGGGGRLDVPAGRQHNRHRRLGRRRRRRLWRDLRIAVRACHPPRLVADGRIRRRDVHHRCAHHNHLGVRDRASDGSSPRARGRPRIGTSSAHVSTPTLAPTLRGYRREWLAPDLIAAATLLVIAVPEQLATSRLAGMPPITGLYAFIAGTLVFVLLGSSPQVSVGADSTIAPLFAAGLGVFASTGSAATATSSESSR